MIRDYGTDLDRAIHHQGPVKVTPGGSGYFSRPSLELDPNLFDGTHLKPAVRAWLVNTLYGFWDRKYRNARIWSTIWLAGSGISYQWAADRSNGDLDVLVGVNWPQFAASNPAYRSLTPQQAADHIDLVLKTELWPRTAHTHFNGQTYEVTYYVNATGSDIRTINPYAAYNLTTDTWTVRPPALPTNPARLYPKAYSTAIAGESRTVSDLVDRYNALSRTLHRTRPGTPGHATATAQLHHVTAQAGAMFDDIHLGRRAAFRPGGSGYGDWNNYRWQAHKAAGTVQALAAITTAASAAASTYATDVYGQDLQPADRLLTRALLAQRGVR